MPGDRLLTITEFPYAITDCDSSSQLPPSKHRCTWWSPVVGWPSGTLESNVTLNGSDTVAPSLGEAIFRLMSLPVDAPALEHAAATSESANRAPTTPSHASCPPRVGDARYYRPGVRVGCLGREIREISPRTHPSGGSAGNTSRGQSGRGPGGHRDPFR